MKYLQVRQTRIKSSLAACLGLTLSIPALEQCLSTFLSRGKCFTLKIIVRKQHKFLALTLSDPFSLKDVVG